LYIYAKAFRSREGDENWNLIADLDDNKETNIIDLYKVARDWKNGEINCIETIEDFYIMVYLEMQSLDIQRKEECLEKPFLH